MSLPIRIQLPPDFLKEEMICGFRVTEKRKKIWAVELDLVQRFVDVCKKYDIHYSMYWGSILGAVRHKGFIPWDDDFDFILDRTNFDKLLNIPNEEFEYPYFLQTALSDPARFCPYARLRNSATTGMVACDKTTSYNNGIYIDLYVFDGVAPNRFWLKLHSILKNIALLPLLARCEFLEGDKHRLRSLLLRPLAKCLPLKFWWWIYCKVLAIFTPFTEKIGAAYSFKPQDHFDYWTTKKDFAECTTLRFDSFSLPVVRDYVRFLTRRYGDYMRFPPVEERGLWHDGVIEFDPDMSYIEYLSNCHNMVRL